MDSDNIAIKVKNVSKYFAPSAGQQTIKQLITRQLKKDKKYAKDGYWAVKNADFDVKKGEFFGIVGRNGSGKSTLLKMMAGVYTPTDGAIGVNGKLVPFIELGVGFNAELSGRDNVFLNGALLGFSRQEMEAMYDEIVSFAELQDHMEVKLKNFSSGMQVRLAFSIAIRSESDILLIDEVLAVGDSAFQQKCFEYFGRIKNMKKTVVFVSHDMDSVKKYCDRAVFVKEGRVGVPNTPEKIAMEYVLENSTSSETSEEPNSIKLPPKSGITLESVELVGAKNMKNVFKDSDELTVSITASSTKDYDVICAISINTMDGRYVAGYNTREELGKLHVSRDGKLQLVCKMPVLQFAKGVYKINTIIQDYDEGTILAYKDFNLGSRVPRLTVDKDSKSKDGQFNIQGAWSKV